MNIKKKKDQETEGTQQVVDAQRREFLRMSMYAAYATPVIMSVLVEKASAGSSSAEQSNPNCKPIPKNRDFICSNQQACNPPPGYCD